MQFAAASVLVQSIFWRKTGWNMFRDIRINGTKFRRTVRK